MHPQPHMATPVIRKPETAVYRCDGSCLLHNLSPRIRTKKKPQVLEMAVLQRDVKENSVYRKIIHIFGVI